MCKLIFNRIISTILAAVMLFSAPAVLVHADDAAPGKYVSDVMIAYGKTQDEANKWLTDNGWEPLAGNNDFTAGKNSAFDSAIVTAMGIKRTDNAKDAITDMAVMNMKGGYSLPDYKTLLEEKKAEIDEFINNFMVVIREYRDNYNGKGSEEGRKRAELSYNMLNEFTDGEEDDPNAVNDTFMRLGDLFLQESRQEGNESGGDLQQILLESSSAAMLAVEIMLAMASDTGSETWIERLSRLSEDELTTNLGDYVPEAKGQDVAPSAVTGLLNAHFADDARTLAGQWPAVHQKMLDYENYNNEHGLWQEDGEDDEAYAARVNQYFSDLKAEDEERYEKELTEYQAGGIFYNSLYSIEYSGSWGETLGDFFNPSDGTDLSAEPDVFLPMAAVLSDGQKASLDFLSLSTLLYIGMGDATVLEQAAPDISSLITDDAETISVYTGVNRSAFRGGVAITSQALMEQNMGRGSAFDKLWDNTGMYAIISYAAAAVGVLTLTAGIVMAVKGTTYPNADMASYNNALRNLEQSKDNLKQALKSGNEILEERSRSAIENWTSEAKDAKGDKVVTGMGTAGRWMIGIGGALLIGAAVLKAYQMYKYYQRDFTPIPLMIVDESDVVTYLTNDDGTPMLGDDGNQLKDIEFNTYEYYEAVKCNRQEVGKISDWQDGVAQYKEHGCGDVADLNGDFGQEWLALYTVKSDNKGKPILADSLKLQYGSDAQPEGTEYALHFFEYTYALDLGDTAYSYNNKKGGVYFFWDSEENTDDSKTASAFSGGHIALAAAGGLIIGLLAATLIMLPKRKKKED